MRAADYLPIRALVVVTACLVSLATGCSLPRQPEHQEIGELGRFEAYQPADDMRRIMIGAPHGTAEPTAVEYAEWLSQRTGAGLIVAYGFGARRLPVVRPLVVSTSVIPPSDNPLRRTSIYREFKQLLEQTGGGKVNFYVGVRLAADESDLESIEIATSGFSFEQLSVLKEFYQRIRNRELQGASVPKIPVAMEPLDRISWQVSGIKHHGVLMSAERGINIRLPTRITAEPFRTAYKQVLAKWVSVALNLARHSPSSIPRVEVKLMDHGRIEFIPSRRQRKGVVIAAPHGTFDEHTAGIVRQISYRTGMAAVIANGFTPTETPGWRINVNRPSERHYPGGGIEIGSGRAKAVYDIFRETVLKASQGELKLHVDIHQNGTQRDIEVATIGISADEARRIKSIYHGARDLVLASASRVAAVDLRIEPIDEIEIGAWAAKAGGILGLAKKSLHFELPLYETLGTAKARDAYSRILVRLLNGASALLVNPAKKAPGRADAKMTASNVTAK
jgi:hypothetical protein